MIFVTYILSFTAHVLYLPCWCEDGARAQSTRASRSPRMMCVVPGDLHVSPVSHLTVFTGITCHG